MNRGGAPTGNKNGAKQQHATNAIRQACNRIVEGDPGGRKYLAKIAEELVIKAAEGEPWAVKEVIDRLDGKPAVNVDATNHLIFEEIRRVVVDEDIIEHTNGTGLPAPH